MGSSNASGLEGLGDAIDLGSFGDSGDIEGSEPRMTLKKRSKSSGQFQLTINFDLDDFDQHHLSADVKRKIVQAFEAANQPKTELKSFGELTSDTQKLGGLVEEDGGIEVNRTEYATLTKALLANMVLERRKQEMHRHLDMEYSKAPTDEVGNLEKPDIQLRKNEFDIYLTPE